MRVLMTVIVMLMASAAGAQQIPPPSGPVLFCGVQNGQAPDVYRVSVDGMAPEPLTMDAAVHPECEATATHSFQLTGTRFPLGNHIVVVYAVNEFGATPGNEYQVQVGIAPGQFTITSVRLLPGE